MGKKRQPSILEPAGARLYVEWLERRFPHAWPPYSRSAEARRLTGLVQHERQRYGEALAYALRDAARLLNHRRLKAQQSAAFQDQPGYSVSRDAALSQRLLTDDMDRTADEARRRGYGR